MIRPEIEELERLGPLPADDDDDPGIDRKLFDVEHLLAAVDPPVTVEEALRIYADRGLLPPRRVDPTNGYRYYAEDQIRTGWLIAVLRSADLSLDGIADIVGAEVAAEVIAPCVVVAGEPPLGVNSPRGVR